MSNNYLEDFDVDLLLTNLAETQVDPLPPIPTSSLTTIDLPQGTAMAITLADSQTSLPNINSNRDKADEGLIVLDDDKGLFFKLKTLKFILFILYFHFKIDSSLIDITKDNDDIIIISPDCQVANSRPRNIIHLKQRKFPMRRTQFIKPSFSSGNIFVHSFI